MAGPTGSPLGGLLMGDIMDAGAAFLPRLAKAADAEAVELLGDFFRARTARWKYWYFECEGGGIDLFCDLQNHLPAKRAAGLLAGAVDLALRQKDSNLLATALWLLVTLARIGKTRRAPSGLSALEARVAPRRDNKDVDFLWDTVRKQFRPKASP